MFYEFISLAQSIRLKFAHDPSLDLTPLDLYQMARNYVVLEPMSENARNKMFFKSRLRCLLCAWTCIEVEHMILHCQRGSHRHNVYKAETPSNSSASESFTSKGVFHAIEAASNPLSPSQVLDLVAASTAVPDLICELCQITVNDIDLFLLHLTGFGHTERRRRLADRGLKYFLAFLNPESERIYLFSVTDREIVRDVNRLVRLQSNWCGYSHIKQVSTLHPSKLREFHFDSNS